MTQEELERELALYKYSLDRALHLASVPEHCQDDEWYAEYSTLQELVK